MDSLIFGKNGQIVLDFMSLASSPSKGCLMAMMDKNLTQKMSLFSVKNIAEENLAPDGRENESHVTILYGFEPDFVVTDELEPFLATQEPMTMELGSISRFESPEYDVLKAEINCDAAQKLHYALKNKFKDSIVSKFPVYFPHATLAYVKKGAHPELDGHEGLKGLKFSVDSLLFSPADGKNRKNLKLKQ